MTNPNLRDVATINQKKALLNSFQDKIGVYESIVYFDLQGNPLFQSRSNRPVRQNYSDRQYFQDAIATKQTTINGPDLSPLSGQFRIEYVTPVKDAWTDEPIGILRFYIPEEKLNPLLINYIQDKEKWFFVNNRGAFFASAEKNFLNQPVKNYYPQIARLHNLKRAGILVLPNPLQPERQQLVSYAPIFIDDRNTSSSLGAAIAIDTDIAFAALPKLKWIFLGGTIVTALLVGTIVVYLTGSTTKRLLQITSAVGNLSQGQLDTRIPISRKDELALLGMKINSMAEQFKNLVQQQQTMMRTSELISKMSQGRSLKELQLPFNLFLTEVRSLIKSDRVIFYQFDENWWGTVVAESVAEEFPRTLGVQFEDTYLAQNYVGSYQRGRIEAVANIHQANLSDCYLEQLEPYGVQASLVVPVIAEGQINRDTEQLIGLLIAHQCSDTRVWQESDVEYLQQVSYQLGMVLRGYIFLREQKQQKANLQADIGQLTRDLAGIASGDLTVTTPVQYSSLGSVAELFNSSVNNLSQAISFIQTPSRQLDRKLSINRNYLIQLKNKLSEQANCLALVFVFIEQIIESIKEMDVRVGLAAQEIDVASIKIESEQVNVNAAIASTIQLREILQDTISKIKGLEIASQEMSRAVSIFGQINLRTSLLANKLKERSLSEEQFRLVIEKEQSSIKQAIAVTQELEKIARNIESKVAEVLRDMEIGAVRNVDKMYLSEQTSNNLEQIAATSQNFKQLIQSIANNTNLQLSTAEKMGELKLNIIRGGEVISQVSDRSLNAQEETALTAQDLHNAINFFKLKPATEEIEDEGMKG